MSEPPEKARVEGLLLLADDGLGFRSERPPGLPRRGFHTSRTIFWNSRN